MRNGDPNYCGNHRKNIVQVAGGQPEAPAHRLPRPVLGARLGFPHPGRGSDPRPGRPGASRQGAVHWHLRYPRLGDLQANTMAELRGWTSFVGMQAQYSLIERTPRRELLPMSGRWISVCSLGNPRGGRAEREVQPRGGRRRARFPLGFDRPRSLPADRRSGAAGGRGSDCHALPGGTRLGAPPAGGDHPHPGARSLAQLQDNLGALQLTLSFAQVFARLDDISRIELGFPHDFLRRSEDATWFPAGRTSRSMTSGGNSPCPTG